MDFYYTSSSNKLTDSIIMAEKEIEIMKQNYFQTHSNKLLLMIENKEDALTSMKSRLEKIKQKVESQNE